MLPGLLQKTLVMCRSVSDLIRTYYIISIRNKWADNFASEVLLKEYKILMSSLQWKSEGYINHERCVHPQISVWIFFNRHKKCRSIKENPEMTCTLLPMMINLTDLSSCLLPFLTRAEMPTFRGGRGEWSQTTPSSGVPSWRAHQTESAISREIIDSLSLF